MRNLYSVLSSFATLFFVSLIFLTSCTNILIGEKVRVGPTEIGRVLTESGFEDDLRGPSVFRLDRCWFTCPELITIDASDHAYHENVRVYMSEDDVFINVPVRVILSLDRSRVKDIFNALPADRGMISVQSIYNAYAQESVFAVARSFLSRGSVSDFLQNQEALTEEFKDELNIAMDRTPFRVIDSGIREIGLPESIEKALEDTANRRIQIRQQNEQKLVDEARLLRELEENRLQRLVDVEKAEADAAVQRIIAEAYTSNYERYRMLTVMEQMANSDNKVFMPIEMLGSMALDLEMAKDK